MSYTFKGPIWNLSILYYEKFKVLISNGHFTQVLSYTSVSFFSVQIFLNSHYCIFLDCSGSWKVFTGNEIGMLLGWWAMHNHKKQNPHLYNGIVWSLVNILLVCEGQNFLHYISLLYQPNYFAVFPAPSQWRVIILGNGTFSQCNQKVFCRIKGFTLLGLFHFWKWEDCQVKIDLPLSKLSFMVDGAPTRQL